MPLIPLLVRFIHSPLGSLPVEYWYLCHWSLCWWGLCILPRVRWPPREHTPFFVRSSSLQSAETPDISNTASLCPLPQLWPGKIRNILFIISRSGKFKFMKIHTSYHSNGNIFVSKIYVGRFEKWMAQILELRTLIECGWCLHNQFIPMSLITYMGILVLVEIKRRHNRDI